MRNWNAEQANGRHEDPHLAARLSALTAASLYTSVGSYNLEPIPKCWMKKESLRKIEIFPYTGEDGEEESIPGLFI